MARVSTLALATAVGGLAHASSGVLCAFTLVGPPQADHGRSRQLRKGGRKLEGYREAPPAAAAPRLPSDLGNAILAGAVGAAAASSGRRRRARGRTCTLGCRALAVGTEVLWNGKPGTVRFLGATQFATGEWAGIELDAEGGMHNGTVMGITYFECPPRRGVFALAATLTARGAPAAAPAAAAGGPAGGSRVPAVGEAVAWRGKEGTVRFVGSTSFAGGEWVGIELKTDEGMHNGTVLGTTYFECPPRRGVFAPASQLEVAGPAPEAVAAASRAEDAGEEAALEVEVGARVVWQGKEGTVRYRGATKFSAGEWVGLELDEESGMHDGTVMGVTYFECAPRRGVFAQASQLLSAGASVDSVQGLSVGTRVAWNGQEGTVRFVGKTKFAGGLWVGLELDSQGGLHDGTVMGISYFKCSPGCGILTPRGAVQVVGEACFHAA